MKILKIILGLLVVIIGITMCVFTWCFFFKEETTIIQLVSLYVALLISCSLIAIGTFVVVFKNK